MVHVANHRKGLAGHLVHIYIIDNGSNIPGCVWRTVNCFYPIWIGTKIVYKHFLYCSPSSNVGSCNSFFVPSENNNFFSEPDAEKGGYSFHAQIAIEFSTLILIRRLEAAFSFIC